MDHTNLKQRLTQLKSWVKHRCSIFQVTWQMFEKWTHSDSVQSETRVQAHDFWWLCEGWDITTRRIKWTSCFLFNTVGQHIQNFRWSPDFAVHAVWLLTPNFSGTRIPLNKALRLKAYDAQMSALSLERVSSTGHHPTSWNLWFLCFPVLYYQGCDYEKNAPSSHCLSNERIHSLLLHLST